MNSIEKYTLTLIGEDVDSPDVFTEGSTAFELIRGSINDGITEINLASGGYERTYHLVTLQNRFIYRMNWERDHFVYAIEVFDRNDHRKLEQTSINQIDAYDQRWMKTNGYASHYFHVGHEALGIYRRPSETGRVLEVRSVAVPQDYAQDEVPRLRQIYHRAAAYYACSEYYASRGDAKRATQYYEDYMELADMKRFKPGYMNMLDQRQGDRGYRTPQIA